MSLDGDRRVSADVDAETLRFPVFPRSVVMLEDGQGRLSLKPPGARGRNRTGTGLPPRDFHTRYGLHRCARPADPPAATHLGSGLYLCPAATSACIAV